MVLCAGGEQARILATRLIMSMRDEGVSMATERKRGLHDMIAGTLVVKMR